MMKFFKKIGEKIKNWYEKYHKIGILVTAFLFVWQIVHLVWLLLDVVVVKLGGQSLFVVSGIWEQIIVWIDYTEVPALIMGTFVYVMEMKRNGFSWKLLLMIFFLNSQWLHIYWITDEFVVSTFGGKGGNLPEWLAWVAIGIDYLELPVIYDMVKRSILFLLKRKT